MIGVSYAHAIYGILIALRMADFAIFPVFPVAHGVSTTAPYSACIYCACRPYCMHTAMEDGGQSNIEEDDMTANYDDKATNHVESTARETCGCTGVHNDACSTGCTAEGGSAGERCRHGEGEGSVPSADRAACEEFLDALEPVCEHTADDLRERLQQGRRQYGPSRANGDWMREPLRVWLCRLDRGMIDLDEAMVPLAVGINEVLSMRDALILSVVGDSTMRDPQMLMDIVKTPHARHVVMAVHKALSAEFDDRDGPDRARCRTAVLMLAAMAKVMPERMKVQPLAIISYILWWTGDSRAEDYALSCLAIDEECSLAAIVLKSVSNGLYPACCGG